MEKGSSTRYLMNSKETIRVEQVIVQSAGCGVQGVGCRVKGVGHKAWGVGCRVWGRVRRA